jgi:hypothetical protein
MNAVSLLSSHHPVSDPSRIVMLSLSALSGLLALTMAQTCVIDSRLYMDSGMMYYGTDVNNQSEPEMSKCFPSCANSS